MALAVLKFGGTSLSTEVKREYVYEKIISYKKNYDHIVVVVSAQGREGDPYATDTLINLIDDQSGKSNKREIDMIYSCGEIITASIVASGLCAKGHHSISMTGWQAGIMTDVNHFDADILSINTKSIRKQLSLGKIIVVAGSQGLTHNGDISTLGRGGSDTTAVALGSALKAEATIIYTDVEGIMTADPKLIDTAIVIEKADFEFCREYSDCGAKVIHNKAARLAQQMKCNNLYIRSTFLDSQGTKITNQKGKVFGVACDSNERNVTIVHTYPAKSYENKLASIVKRHEAVDIRSFNKLFRFNLPEENFRFSLKEIHNELLGLL
ncbi:MAG: aspartate kinase [Eubacteriales bacterium]|nr:aspartate kinase [Eubacteriales bacterium]